MIEQLITISLVGLITGFIFSVPVAGPISILITSKALKGDLHYCAMSALGASIIDMVYCFIAVFGFTKLIALYQPMIPYILLIGALFLCVIGYKISKTKIDIEHLGDKSVIPKRVKTQDAFWTGFLVNFLNPTLFFGWMTSSFIIMTFVSSLGFQTGGLEGQINQQINHINGFSNVKEDINSNTLSFIISKNETEKKDYKQEKPLTEKISGYDVFISLCYSTFVAIGTIIWFYYFSVVLIKYRKKFKIPTINKIIQVLGFVLCGFGAYLAYKAIQFF